MTNYWLQVNLWGTPENFGVLRFKLALWKVGGIKIKSAAGRQKITKPKWKFVKDEIFFSSFSELPAKLGGCSKKPIGHNFDFRAKSSWEIF